jgi:hypothetical protein
LLLQINHDSSMDKELSQVIYKPCTPIWVICPI